jgi:hypothetical protein
MKSLLVAVVLPLSLLHGQEEFTSSFSPAREYFILRSGRAKLIIQAERTGVAPAVTWMLFDAERPCQSKRKDRAFNFAEGEGCSASALTVVLGGTSFQALGHTTRVRWTMVAGVPSVEARWWAGGFEVTETITALRDAGAFLRTVRLRGADIAGTDTVTLRFGIPDGSVQAHGAFLAVARRGASLAIGIEESRSRSADAGRRRLETGRIILRPGEEAEVRTVLVADIPAPGAWYPDNCGEEQNIPAAVMRPDEGGSAPYGLTAEFFNNPQLRGRPSVSRIDTNLSPYWDTGAPAGLSRADSFSVRWSGVIRPPSTGTYAFSLAADDRARFFIDGKPVIDCWENCWNATKRAEVSLRAGTVHSVRVEFAELSGWAGMRLKWTPPRPPVDKRKFREGLASLLERAGDLLRGRATAAVAAGAGAWGRANQVQADDSLVTALFFNATAALPGMVAENGRMDAGIFEYGLQWVRDGSNVALGLVHAGQFEAARGILQYIITDLISGEGATVVAGEYDAVDREELDQMGELMHALKTYVDWSGDLSLIHDHREKLVAMVERPLRPEFLDSSMMVHGRREYWERTFDDAYELAYQVFMVRGLLDASDLAGELGVPGKRVEWKGVAGKILSSVLHHPTLSLVVDGAFIKRRNVTGAAAEYVAGWPPSGGLRDDPLATEAAHRLDPDASYALPVLLDVIEPESGLARKTLDKLEGIWNARWEGGGYERYHSSSQGDQPGPWCFSTAFIARAQHEAGLVDRSRRSLEWLLTVPGGNAGAWYEEIPLNRSQMATAGIVPWASGEIASFVVRDWLGMRFEGSALVIAPRMFPGRGGCTASIRFRHGRIDLRVGRTGRLDEVRLDGKLIPPGPDGRVIIP